MSNSRSVRARAVSVRSTYCFVHDVEVVQVVVEARDVDGRRRNVAARPAVEAGVVEKILKRHVLAEALRHRRGEG